MKAMLCKEFGPPEKLVLEEVASPRPGKGQVAISVKACSVSFPDTLIIQGKYQFKPAFPFSPGSEFAGIVKEIGEGVTNVRVGDRVAAFTIWGGFAEEVLAQAEQLVRLPQNIDFATASTAVMTYGTTQYALKDRGQLKSGETLLVLGAAGGVGIAAIEIGKLLGARIIAAASTDEKLALCKQYGADETINYSTENLKERIKALTAGNGVDVIYDPIGGEYAEAALRGMAWKGRYLVVGFAAGSIPRIPLNLTLLKGCSIIGVFWGDFTQREPELNQVYVQELLGWLATGKIRPYISATYPLARATDALNEIIQRKVKGKIVLLLDDKQN
ncbi:NADPH:quinone oxidoreductase family protein [Ktedonosporobacter rubrisoli]|uniref:NADPH:quinone oxidoreductase family protein n=1 Tax=Ktedonosporobacter rubrisoli TaxID=2509675 RepID=A0A4P6K124_KTERU|nr:NADPH:quinone oxidoreductase family protein [Ktedonosporobacter rubrisoli]QBD81675.1 NADPH:quinone oxidoreductase family protein [Ktedonosporobacter rubrisoli]